MSIIFTKILKILARKESMSLTKLSQEVGCSAKTVQSALEHMEHMGYIYREVFEQACTACRGSDHSNQCEGCGFASGDKYTIWLLTERGQSLVNSRI